MILSIDFYQIDKCGFIFYYWNVGGKVTRVLKEEQWLGFDYDVMGNRLLKRLADKRSLYVRDAHGNTMAVYETQTREEEEDTDRTTGYGAEKQMFVRLLHGQMEGANTAEKTDNFLKKFVHPLEGVSSGELSTLRSTLIYAMDYGSNVDADYNDAVEGIEELTGESTAINKDNFGVMVELWFRNHAWSGSIPAQLYRTRHRKLVQKEVHLYGSSRLGLMERRTNETDFLMLADIQVEEVWNPFNNSYIAENRLSTVSSPQPETTLFVGTLGLKRYELCNHLGNVQAVITDRTLPHNNSGTIDFYIADLLSATDYYPFGMVLPGRSLETDKYRFGFNGKEFDKEWNSGEMTYDYGFRIYDPRLGRFLSVDPLTESYPWLTPYQFAENTPIFATDLDGAETNTPAAAQAYFNHANKVVVESFKSGLKTLARAYDFFLGAEDATKAITGKDWDGKQQTNQERVQSAGWVALSVLPVGKLAKGAKLLIKGFGEVIGLGARYGDDVAHLVLNSVKKATEGAKEIITITKSGTLDDAIKVAKSEIGNLGSDAKPVIGKFEYLKGKQVGWQSADGKRGWRIDYDAEKKAHVNWWNAKEDKGAVLWKGESENHVKMAVDNEIPKSYK